MKWIRTHEQSLPSISGSVLTIGNFDGVHLGHQKLLNELISTSQRLNLPSVACTFKPHPLQVIQKADQKNPVVYRLFDYRDQADQMEKLQVDYLIEEKFTKELSLMSAVDFMDKFVVKYFNPHHLVVGYDFSFGRDRSGDFNFLTQYCKEHKIGLTRVLPEELYGQIISSTAIRQFIEVGEMQKAAAFLGRPYYFQGPVRMGHQRGRILNVPTANISPEIEFTPRKGVYFSKTYVEDRQYFSISNIGINPTFETSDVFIKVETHMFDFNQDIYGSVIKVELLQFHRDEVKFSSVESLKKQIDKDLLAARVFFNI